MALTKINFYIGFLASYVLIMISVLGFMTAIIQTDIPFKPETEAFVNQFVIYVNNTDITQISDADVVGIKEQPIITTGNETGESSVTDNLATINYYAVRINYVATYFNLAYNAPSFIMYVLVADYYESMQHFVNIAVVIVFISIVILFVREVRGS